MIPVLDNDTDPDADPRLVNSIVANGTKGVASITAGAGSITYQANVGATGADSFTYTAKDSHAAVSNVATVYITISGAAPVANNLTQHVAYNASATNVVLSVTGSYTSATVVTQPGQGSASASSATISYTPASNQTASTSFTYKVTGPGGVSNTATITIIIDAPQPPTISGGSISTAYNTAGSVTLTLGGGPTSSTSIVSQGSKGVATISGATATYTPNAGQTGPDAFSVQATGPGGTSSPATVNVTIAAAPNTLTATANPSSYERIRYATGWGPTTAVTVTPSGGNGVYSYSWAYLSGAPSFTIDNASGATVTWLKPGALTPGVFLATWRCTVSDTAGHSTYVDVSVEIDEEDAG